MIEDDKKVTITVGNTGTMEDAEFWCMLDFQKLFLFRPEKEPKVSTKIF